ncbi:hypothetical protein [Nitrosospira sp. Nsp1]|uniref:hypothetical protein n=1 Tax=Nitrosospira sp. Nsp1 TaxID=136547 RepID=UPI0008911C95|nr:hypothetical protein [Nitrosospira sp. Nsp1]SCX62745.1 hypothetical protein SAMN05720354_13229 [Nitrosospira sp. Nsp1]
MEDNNPNKNSTNTKTEETVGINTAASTRGGGGLVERDAPATLPKVEIPPVERESPAVLPNVRTPQPPTFRDHAGYKLTWSVLIGLFVVILAFFSIIVFDAPSPMGGAPEAKQLLASCLKPDFDVNQCTDERIALAKVILDDPAIASHRQYWKDMFQQIIGATLLPILTALLGYLFGSGATARSTDTSVK